VPLSVALRCIPLLACLFGELAMLPTAHGQIVTAAINPVSDAFVTPGADGSLANYNYGGAGALAISATGSPNGPFQTAMQFNFASTAASLDAEIGVGLWSIQMVTLQLAAANPVNAIFNPSMAGQITISWMQNNNWAEGAGSPNSPDTTTPNALTYNSLQTLISANDQTAATFSFSGTTSGTVTVSFAPPPGLLAEILAGGLSSFRLYAADSQVSMLVNSRSFPIAANQPMLTLTAIPEPGAGALAALGLATMTGLIRRRGPRNRFSMLRR
jgi:hypothetical protein